MSAETKINVLDAGDVAERTAGELRLAQTAAAGKALITNTDMKQRAVEILEKGLAHPCANDEQRMALASAGDAYARDAADAISRCDYGALASAITSFTYAVQDIDKIGPPTPSLMPGEHEFFLAGWQSEEQIGLRNILSRSLLGVAKGDRCVSVDANGAKLASGKHLSRKQALEGYVPPAGGRIIAVGRPAFLTAATARREQS